MRDASNTDIHHQWLRQNQNDTEYILIEYLSHKEVARDTNWYKAQREKLINEIRQTINLESTDMVSFARGMDLAEELRDLSQGILWVKKQNQDKTITLIRDARGISDLFPPAEHQPVSNDSYLIQLFNIAWTVETLLHNEKIEVENRQIALEALKRELGATLRRSEDGEAMSIQQCNQAMVRIAEEAGILNAVEKIDVAMDFSNLKRSQYHVATITKCHTVDGKQALIAEVDNMMLGLTTLQKAQYQAISQAPKRNNVALTFNGKQIDMSWYNELPLYQKDLVHEVAPSLAKGNMVIPTQLKKMTIGLRNAHSKSTYVMKNSEAPEAKLELVQRTLHTGTVSFHGYGDKQFIANENAKQLQSFVEVGARINVNILNSPINITNIDFKIHTQVTEAQKVLGGTRSTTPLNALRRISRNYTEGFDTALKAIDNALKAVDMQKFQKIADFIGTGNGNIEAKKQLDALAVGLDSKLVTTLKIAIQARELMGQKLLLRDHDNRNVQLSSAMKRIEFAVNNENGALYQLFKRSGVELSVDYISTQCASGKDRTGLIEIDTSFKAVLDTLDISDAKGEEAGVILNSMIGGGHTAFMASINGGTPGAHGIKPIIKQALPIIYHKCEGLSQATADNNSLKIPKAPILIMVLDTIISTANKLKVKVGKLIQKDKVPNQPTYQCVLDTNTVVVNDHSKSQSLKLCDEIKEAKHNVQKVHHKKQQEKSWVDKIQQEDMGTVHKPIVRR